MTEQDDQSEPKTHVFRISIDDDGNINAQFDDNQAQPTSRSAWSVDDDPTLQQPEAGTYWYSSSVLDNKIDYVKVIRNEDLSLAELGRFVNIERVDPQKPRRTKASYSTSISLKLFYKEYQPVDRLTSLTLFGPK